MQLEIITPDKKVYEGEVSLVRVPGSKGSFEILNSHAPIVSTLDKGTIKIRETNGTENFYEISGGVIEVKSNKIIVLAESME